MTNDDKSHKPDPFDPADVAERLKDAINVSAPNTMLIEKMYAFLSVDAKNNFEGVIAFPSSMGPMPMIAADEDRLRMLIPIAKMIAENTECRIKIVEYSTRKDLGEIWFGDGIVQSYLDWTIARYNGDGS